MEVNGHLHAPTTWYPVLTEQKVAWAPESMRKLQRRDKYSAHPWMVAYYVI
jgi:hypothetical protein